MITLNILVYPIVRVGYAKNYLKNLPVETLGKAAL
jgi:hypothetical protein